MDPDTSTPSPSISSTDAGQPPSTSSTPLSKNKLRKLRQHAKVLSSRLHQRQKERSLRKHNRTRKSLGQIEKSLIASTLRDAFVNPSAPEIVIDCQYGSFMTLKEQTRLAQQLCRVYSSNKKCALDLHQDQDNQEQKIVKIEPVHLIFSSLSKTSEFFSTCCKQNDGFANYIVDFREESVKELFPIQGNQELIYLSPDSPNVLEEFDPTKVYIIGGLVDETTSKNISLEFSHKNKISSKRLPIDEYFMRDTTSTSSGTFKQVLTVNQVFDIVLEWFRTKDWVKAISAGLPSRTGFVPREICKDK